MPQEYFCLITGSEIVLKEIKQVAGLLFVVSCFAISALAQGGRISLKGRVTDPSGAFIPAATVTLTGPNGFKNTVQTDEHGIYDFPNLQPGRYAVKITTTGFSTFTKSLVLVSGRPQVVNARLSLNVQKQSVTVTGQTHRLSVSPESNVSALVLQGSALKALSNDPDELQSELTELAGPAAGPNGGQIYIDGFAGGQLPPKQDILSIRVNSNPFTAARQKLGYGRIDITTKPGFAQWHGSAFIAGNDQTLNSRNPFVPSEPPYDEYFGFANIGGPLGKKVSFFFPVFHRTENNNSIVDADVLNSNFAPQSLTEAVRNPSSMTFFGPRFDFQLSQKNVLSAQFHDFSETSSDNGTGQFGLPSQGYNMTHTHYEVHGSDTQVLSAATVNQLLFAASREVDDQSPVSFAPTLNVQGGFTSGGSSMGIQRELQYYSQLRDVVTKNKGRNLLSFGGEVYDIDESLNSQSGFNGEFTFPSLSSYQIAEEGLAQHLPASQILADGGGPSQFEITEGNPLISANLVQYSVFGEDTARLARNVSLTLGLRVEGQTQIANHVDFAPRMGFAWGIGGGAKGPKTVIRAGGGLFYDWFEMGDVLQAEQLNGINQYQFLVNSPEFLPPQIPAVSTLAAYATYPTKYEIAPNFDAPYSMVGAASIERQVTRNLKASVTYIGSHAVHQLLTRNINAPLPGTFILSDPTSGVRPFGDAAGNIYQYEDAGLYNENQIIANFNVNLARFVSLFGYYTLSFANTNVSCGGVAGGEGTSTGSCGGGFPMNQYDLAEDYGTAAWASRNRFFVGGSFTLPMGVSLSPFLVANSGSPYNITVGQNLNGSSIFNNRPAFSPTLCPTCVATSLGIFNTDPAYGTPLVPINDFTGPGQFSMNVRISKTFGFGKEAKGGGGGPGGGHYHHGGGLGGRGLTGGGGGGGGFFHPGGGENRKYQLEVGLMAHNVFNRINLGTPVGIVGSPLFGQSNSLAGGFFNNQSSNRMINVFMRFSF
jgi:hypothetical protein